MVITKKSRDEMTEEEIDALFRPKQTNSRKSLTPLYVYFVLERHSSEKHPLRQKDIRRWLREDFELDVERKALGRIINTMVADGESYICIDPERGMWLWY